MTKVLLGKEYESNIEMLQYILLEEFSHLGYLAHIKTQSYERQAGSIFEPEEEESSQPFGMIGLPNTFTIKANTSQAGLKPILPV